VYYRVRYPLRKRAHPLPALFIENYLQITGDSGMALPWPSISTPGGMIENSNPSQPGMAHFIRKLKKPGVRPGRFAPCGGRH
jgi:hypothetical protein